MFVLSVGFSPWGNRCLWECRDHTCTSGTSSHRVTIRSRSTDRYKVLRRCILCLWTGNGIGQRDSENTLKGLGPVHGLRGTRTLNGPLATMVVSARTVTDSCHASRILTLNGSGHCRWPRGLLCRSEGAHGCHCRERCVRGLRRRGKIVHRRLSKR